MEYKKYEGYSFLQVGDEISFLDSVENGGKLSESLVSELVNQLEEGSERAVIICLEGIVDVSLRHGLNELGTISDQYILKINDHVIDEFLELGNVKERIEYQQGLGLPKPIRRSDLSRAFEWVMSLWAGGN